MPPDKLRQEETESGVVMSKVAMGTTKDEVFGEIEIKAPVERVFDALTRQDQLIRWFTDPGSPAEVWEFEPRAGDGVSPPPMAASQ
jgi:hypothetical protein